MTEQEHDPLADADAEGVASTDELEDDDAAEGADDLSSDEAEGDADEAGEEELEDEAPVAAHRTRDRHPVRAAPVAPSVSDIAVHVSDRGSAVFVLAIVGVFVVILLYGMLLGHNGLISGLFPTPSPSPTPIATPAPSPIATDSPVPSGSAAASGSPAASSSVAPSAAPSSAAPSPSAS